MLDLFTVCTIVAVVWRRLLDRRSMAFVWFAVSVLVWCVPYLLWQLSTTAEDALYWCRWLVWGSTFIPVTYLNFVSALTGIKMRRLLLLASVIAVLLAAANWGSWIVCGVEPRLGMSFWPMPGRLFLCYLANFGIFVVLSFVFLLRKYRQSSAQGRNQIKYLIWGTALGFAGGGTNFPLWLNIPLLPFGQGLCIFYILGIAYAIVKFRLMEFNQMAFRVASFVTSLLMLSGAGATLTHWLLGLLRPEMGLPDFYLLWMLFAVAAVLIVPIQQLVSWLVDTFLESRLTNRRHDYRAGLRELAARLSSIHEEDAIFSEALKTLREQLGLRRVAIFFRSEFDHRFQVKAQEGFEPAIDSAVHQKAFDFVRAQLELAPDAFVIEERIGLREVAPDLRRVFEPDDLVVPVRVEDLLYGFFVLGLRGGRQIYSSFDISLLETLAFHVGLTLRARQLERQANQSEKLISLGTLAAGLAHELRNPLVSIQTFSALLRERGHEPEFQQEFGAIMQRDVGRIASIVENVAAFAENSTVPFTPIKIEEVIAGVAEIARPELLRTGVQLQVDKKSDLPPVHGNYSQLLQVFLNLLQNAIHALEGRADGRITVAVTVRVENVRKPMLYITVADNGPGIDPALLLRVFEPFTTTKSTGDQHSRRGMGLGLAIVRRIIQYHQGAIEVTSELGKGTTFHVHLPAHAHLP